MQMQVSIYIPSRNAQPLPAIPHNHLLYRMVAPTGLHLEEHNLAPLDVHLA